MRDPLTQNIYNNFPALYAEHKLPMDSSSMCFGFQCGDGWYDLIFRLSFDLAKIIATSEHLDPKMCTVRCVKEKFGTLRFYMSQQTQELMDRVERAVQESARTCEDCGGEGKLKSDVWMRTICEICDVERQRRRMREMLARRDSGAMEVDELL